MPTPGFVYVMASKRNGTLYIGVTSDLPKRAYEHREGLVDGFTKRYRVRMPVYYEPFDEIAAAIQREEQMKAWKRAWKLQDIERFNPGWRDLFDDIAGG